ncbi:MAG: hypothetical protein MI974_33805 [Chitinophagales bacterium]|nr:hypothetical protein [Chitinophagales bacterium]
MLKRNQLILFFLSTSILFLWSCRNQSSDTPIFNIQQQEIDSLIQRATDAQNLAPHTIVPLSDTVIIASKAIAYEEGEIRGYYHKAIGYFFQSAYPKAEEYCQLVLEKLEATSSLDSTYYHNYSGNTYMLSGILEQKQGNYDHAVSFQLQALKHFEIIEKWNNVANAYGNLSENFRFIKNFEKAFLYNQKAEDFFLKADNPDRIVFVLQNRGNIFYDQGDYQSALELFEITLEKANAIEDFENIVHAINNIGASYEKLGQYEIALQNYWIALEKYQARENAWGEVITLGNISLIHMEMGQLEQAEQFSTEALNIARSQHFLELEKFATENLAEIYEEGGDYQRSLEMAKQGALLQDSLYNQQKFEIVNRLEQQFNEEKSNRIIAQKDKAIIESQLKSQRLSNIAILLALFFFAVLLGAWLFYKQAKFRKEKNDELLQKNAIIQNQNEDLESLVNAYEAQREKFIQIGSHKIPLDDIIYIRYQERISSIFLRDHSIIEHRTQLSHLMAELNYKSHFLFSQINQNYIVHFKNVTIEFFDSPEEKYYFTNYLSNDTDDFRTEEVIRNRKRSGLNKHFEREYQRYLRLEKLLKQK